MSIEIIKTAEISQKEANIYIKAEKQRWQEADKVLGKIELAIDGEDMLITATERSPITRVRRITGYLSTVSSFNDAKAAELHDRYKSVKN